MTRLMLRLILVYSLFLFGASNQIFAFPDFIRGGYKSCSSCHVSPSGGGALTSYGRMISYDMLSSFGENPDPILPDWLILGGDTRYMAIEREGEVDQFPMQSDLEIGIEPVEGLFLMGSAGYYSRDKNLESHRAYLMYRYKFGKNALSVRAGKFMPNYGLMISDHTMQIRRYHLIPERRETLNGEIHLVTKHGEVSVTGILGDTDPEKDIGLSHDDSFESRQGLSVRIAWNFVHKLQFGYSYMNLQRGTDYIQSYGPFLMFGMWDFYALMQRDIQENGNHEYLKTGYEIVKGLHVYGTFQNDVENIYGVKWFPVSHVELLAEMRENYMLGMIHLYF